MATAANDKLAIWNAVSKTDPRHTKKVNQRGGFTAISAHYQVMSATEQFGPVGIGWGYTNGDPIFHETLVIVPVTIWHGTRENTFGPVFGGAEWRQGARVDSDAAKKAATDGLTKALSHLGFNADVFLGRFDDNKYIEEVRKEFESAEAANDQPTGKVEGISKIKQRLSALMKTGNDASDLDAFNALVRSNADDLQKIKDAKHQWWTGDGQDFEGFAAWITRRREELTGGVLSTMIESMRSCETQAALNGWLETNEAAISALDGAEARKFQLAYDLHTSAIGMVDRVTIGA